MKTCAHCERAIDPARLRYPKTKYCSDQCRDRGKSYDYKRTLACATCSKAIYESKTSRPQGLAKCNDCRRAETAQRVKAKPNTCQGCGVEAYGTRCRSCATAFVMLGKQPTSVLRREQARRRQWRDRAAPGLNSWAKRQPLLEMWRKQGRCCAYCSGPAETVDHVIPLARGGTNYEGNLVACCLSCNADKRERVITEWRLAKQAKADRVPAEPPPPRAPKAKPMVWVEQAFGICLQCGALHHGKARCCTPGCEREWNRVEMRNKYRERVGIPLDAPLHSRAA